MRGVEQVDVNRRQNEAVVIRRKGTAPGTELVRAVQGAGYRAQVIPTYQLALECPKLGTQCATDKVRRAFASIHGVRGVGFPAQTKAIVYFDRRRTSAGRLMQVVAGLGLSCNRGN